MSLIKKKTEIVLSQKIKGMIYGEPGIGKSTLALSMPAPVLLFDFDNGVSRIQAEYRTDTVQLTNLQDFKDVLHNEDLSGYKSFVIDGFGKYIERIYNEMLKTGKKSQMTWGKTLEEFKEINLLLNDMPQHICYVAHQKARKTGEGENDKFGVDGSGSAKDYLIGELDYVGYMEMWGKKRGISFSPSEKFYAKNSIGIEDYLEVPVLKAGEPNTFLADVIINPTIKRRQEETKALSIQEDLAKKGMELVKKMKDTPNECLAKLKELDLNLYNKKILFDELKKATSWNYNEQTKVFDKVEKK